MTEPPGTSVDYDVFRDGGIVLDSRQGSLGKEFETNVLWGNERKLVRRIRPCQLAITSGRITCRSLCWMKVNNSPHSGNTSIVGPCR